jgi:hypothetical protein
MRRIFILVAILYVTPVLINSPAEAGRTIGSPSSCRGHVFNGNVFCRQNFDPDVRDTMFIWNIDQLAAQSSSLRSSLEEAQDAWKMIFPSGRSTSHSNLTSIARTTLSKLCRAMTWPAGSCRQASSR